MNFPIESETGIVTIIIAILINFLTGVIKLPIKAYSKKHTVNLNKYISLIPIILGLISAVVYCGIVDGFKHLCAENVISLAVASASLSLSIFAVVEQFFAKYRKGVDNLLTDSHEKAGITARSTPDVSEDSDTCAASEKGRIRYRSFREKNENRD